MNHCDKTVAIVGCGSLGTQLGNRLIASGYHVTGLRRQVSRIPAALHGRRLDLQEADSWGALAGEWSLAVVILTPDQGDEAGYRRTYVEGIETLLEHLQADRWLLVSSTSVYHQHQGEWLDEQAPAEGRNFQGRVLLEMEARARAMLGDRLTCLRLGGIYGPGRERLLRQVQAGLGYPDEPIHYTNRIHEQDAVTALAQLAEHALNEQSLAPCYLGVDNDPAPAAQVTDWLAQQLGIARPLQPGLTLRSGSKRLRNQLLRDTGWTPRYPTFRDGYQEMLNTPACAPVKAGSPQGDAQ